MIALPEIFSKLRDAAIETDPDERARILRRAEAMCAHAALDVEQQQNSSDMHQQTGSGAPAPVEAPLPGEDE